MKKKTKYQPELNFNAQKYVDVNCKLSGRKTFSECRDCYFYNTHNTRRQYISRVLCQEANRIKE